MYRFGQVVETKSKDHAIFPFKKKILLHIKATEELVTEVLLFAHEMECSLLVEQWQNNSHAD